MKRLLAGAALAAGTTMFAAMPAHAGGDVYWSIGINAPLDPYGATIGTTIGNVPRWHRPPVYVRPAPIYYPPAPVYYGPPVVYRPIHVHPRPHGWHHGHHGHPGHGHHHWKRDRDDDRWDGHRGGHRDRWDRHPRRHG